MTAPSTTSDELKYWVSFARIPGVGRVRFQTMLNHFGGMSEAWGAGRASLREAGIDRRTLSTIVAEREKIDPDAELERMAELKITALTWNDEAYPALLKEIDDAPPVLFVRGSLSAVDDWAVSVVGTRQPTPYGRQVAEELAYQLAANRITIVSGLA